MALPPDQQLATTFSSALFYGLYLSTLFHCLRWLVCADEGWKVRKRINWTILSITVVLFVLITITESINLRNSTVLVIHQATSKPPPSGTTLLTRKLPWMAVVTCTNANMSTLLADAVLIYRCWIIYAKSRRVIVLPVTLWLGGLVLMVLQAYWQIVQSASVLKAWQPVNMSVGPGTVLMPFWASTIVLNGYSTFMIVRRIYLVAKESKGLGSQSSYQLKFAMRILIESGFLYLAVAIAQFVSWWTPNAYAIFVISNINLPVTGIAFNLILIRAAQHRAEEMTKAADIAPMSAIQFRAHETKSPVGQFGVNTQAFIFQNVHDDDPVIDISGTPSHAASVV